MVVLGCRRWWCGCVLAGVREEEAEEDKGEKEMKINPQNNEITEHQNVYSEKL